MLIALIIQSGNKEEVPPELFSRLILCHKNLAGLSGAQEPDGYYGFQANVAQTADTQNGVQLMLSVLPAIATAISVIFIFFYPLKEEKLQIIEDELNKKQEQ